MKRSTPTGIQLRFTTNRLERMSADELKQWSKAWGGGGTERKARCIEIVMNGLNSPAKIKARLSKLTALERTALAVLKEQGGVMAAGELEQILRCYGHEIPAATKTSYFRLQCEYVPQLVKHGLILREDDGGYYYSRFNQKVADGAPIWTDERLLAQLTTRPKIQPLVVEPTQIATDAATFRRPAHLLMECLSITRALQQMQGLRLTQGNTIRVSDSRKFAKLLGWENGAAYDGFEYPNIVHLVVGVWMRCSWLAPGDGVLEPNITPAYFEGRPAVDIVSTMMDCSLHRAIQVRQDGYYAPQGAAPLEDLLSYCLRALPDTTQYYRVRHFIEAVYQRMGEHVQPDGVRYDMPYKRAGMSEKQYDEAMRQWQQHYHAEWVKAAETACSQRLFRWLYWLGMVALQTTSSGELIFRVTDLGQQVLAYDGQQPTPHEAVEEQGPAWIVQPNYDVVVYLNQVTPAQLTFMEAHGERQQAEMHTATYLLTRESVHRGLNSGTTLDEVIATLRAGTHTELPQNVEREIRSWATLREQITIHPSGRVIAFATGAERDRALKGGLQGQPMGELYVLAPPSIPLEQLFSGVFGPRTASILGTDYAGPPVRNLKVGEDGSVEVENSAINLLLEGQLARCTELIGKIRAITPESLKAIKQAKISANSFITFLQERAKGGVPEIVEVMIRNTLGTRTKVGGVQAYVLQVTNKRLYEALISTRSLVPYILDVPGPDTILVKMEHAKKFLQMMEEIGVRMTEYEPIEERPDWLETMKDAKQQQRRYNRW